jgi:site-specific recombinase XerD
MWKSVKIARRSTDVAPRGSIPYSMQPVKYLTTAETEAFFGAVPEEKIRDRLMFDLIYRHGLRRSEAALLRLESIQGDRIWIGRVKNGISGEYPLHPTTRKLLALYLTSRRSPENPFLLTTRQSKSNRPISPSTIYQAFRGYAILAGIEQDHQHVHVLRHSIAVHLMNAGWSAEDVQDWLGHKCISSTMIYGKVSNQRREKNYEDTVDSGEIARTTFN